MSFITCPCGINIDDVVWPSSHEYHMISDRDLDVVTNWSFGSSGRVEVTHADLKKRRLLVTECPSCARLLVKGKTAFLTYVLEQTGQTLGELTKYLEEDREREETQAAVERR